PSEDLRTDPFHATAFDHAQVLAIDSRLTGQSNAAETPDKHALMPDGVSVDCNAAYSPKGWECCSPRHNFNPKTMKTNRATTGARAIDRILSIRPTMSCTNGAESFSGHSSREVLSSAAL